MTKLTLWT